MVDLKNIKFGYKKKRPLFSSLNLTLAPGYIYGLLGKNGAGKTTLLKHVSGLLYPDAGNASLFGYDTTERFPQMLEDLYVIPEEFELPAISLNLYAKINSVFYSRFSNEQFRRYLKELELPEDRKLSTLSYGQKKKFLIAFGLATNARLMILDEPTNGLDIPSKSQFRKLVAGALDEEKLIIISTHQVRDLENMIDYVVILENGQVIFNHNVASISEKLLFEQNLNGFPETDILYYEEMPGRRAGVMKNPNGIESRVDLELLFNSVVKNTQIINSQF